MHRIKYKRHRVVLRPSLVLLSLNSKRRSSCAIYILSLKIETKSSKVEKKNKMVDKIEMSLDDIIKTNKIGFRRKGGAAGGGAGRKPVKGSNAAGPRRNQTSTSKFRGTQNRQIGGGARAPQRIPRKFARVRNTT